MTIAPDDVNAIMERAAAERLRRETRINDIMEAPEARGRRLLATALLFRLDLDAATARQILAEAPDDLETVDEIRGYVAAVAPDPATAARH